MDVFDIELRLSQLPVGYISKKTIAGKTRYYHQWTENGKIKSKYLKAGEMEPLQALIDERRALQDKLRALGVDARKPGTRAESFETNVVTGRPLFAMTESVKSWSKRDAFDVLLAYLTSEQTDKVCLVYGLRRTGKTTMLRQALLFLPGNESAKAAYIKATSADTMAKMNRDLTKLQVLGYKYIFIDEATLMEDFIDNAALFSDIFAAQGMKIVLSGTDSLGFWFALDRELYDRAVTIHTTFIPFHEYSRLLGINDIDDYIRYGGTLRAGETNFDDPELLSDGASFRDDESTRRYIDSAICRNIQHSLAYCEEGGHFRHLRSLYDAGELTGAINRIIEDMNHSFLVQVLVRDFKSHDLRMAAGNLRKERDAGKRTDILDRIDTAAVTARLAEMLDIRNREEQTIGITEAHTVEIKEYLKALDLIVNCPAETALPGAEPLERILFTQPGMRYSQALALIHSLMKDPLFSQLSEFEKDRVAERISEEVRGRMMEDIVLLETMKAAPVHKRVFKLQFAAGEFDMVVYDAENDSCEIFEIKHSSEIVPEQYRHLIDKDKCKQTERRFGKIKSRVVIYRGRPKKTEAGVSYRNVEECLLRTCDTMD
jgi:predicted AAA+ superfamily ATPase